MGKQVKELTSFQRTVAIITVVSLAVYSVINLFLVINAYASLDDNVSQLGELVSNWQVGTISDLKIATNCPAGYESASSSRVWPGTKQGCWCGNVDQAKLNAKNITCAPFCEGACSADAKTLTCQDVNSIPEKPLTAWGAITGPTPPKQICLKRSPETWANIAERSTSGTCPDGYLSCDKEKSLVCTKEAECPITSIETKVILSGQIAACTGSVDKNCAIIYNDGVLIKQVTWKRAAKKGEPLSPTKHTTGMLPLAQFKVDEDDICSLMSQDNVSPNREQFYLLNKKLTTCNNPGVLKPQWTKSDTLTEDKLFKANGLDTEIAKLANFDTASMDGYYTKGRSGVDFQWHLFSRGYINWEPSCRNRMQPLINKKTLVDDMRSAQLALLIIGIIASFFLGIPLAFMEIQNLRGVDLSCIDGKGEEERTKLRRFKKFMTYFFKGLQLPFQIWAIIVAGSAKALFMDLSDEQCSDLFTNGVLVYLAKTITTTHKSTVSALGILLGTLLLDIILEAWSKRKSKEEKQKAVSPNSKDERLELANLEDGSSTSPLRNQNSPTQPPIQPTQPMQQMQPAQPQNAPPQQNIVIQIQPGPTGYPPQQQYPPQQGYPPQQYPPQQGYPPQQYPPQQGYPPQQYPPQQGYPPQQQQYPPRY